MSFDWLELAGNVFETLKIASVDILGYYIKAQKVNSLLNAISIIVCVIVIPFLFLKLSKKLIKKKNFSKYEGELYYVFNVLLIIAVSSMVGLIVGLVSCSISGFINPEYYAIKDLISAVSGCQ